MMTRIRWNAALIAGVGAVVSLCPVAAQELPPAMEVDRLLLLAERHSENRDWRAALETLDRILALQSEHNVEVSASVWFRHAQAALRADFPERVRASVVRYVEAAGREGEHYSAALELINEAEVGEAAEGSVGAEGSARPSGTAAPGVSGAGMTPGTVFSDCSACPQMVVVPAGSFVMGSPESDREGDGGERPQHTVRIGSSFAVGVFEVTFAEWHSCVRAGGCAGHLPNDMDRGLSRHPVADVTWEAALAYVQWLSRATGGAVPALDRSGVGVRGARGDDHGTLLGAERFGAVSTRECL